MSEIKMRQGIVDFITLDSLYASVDLTSGYIYLLYILCRISLPMYI